jgi:hypothetical protein
MKPSKTALRHRATMTENIFKNSAAQKEIIKKFRAYVEKENIAEWSVED